MPGNTSKHKLPYPLTGERVADYPATARQMADKLDSIIGKTTEWKNLTLGSGWSATGGHTPRARFISGLIQIEGAVTRGAGGYFHQLAQLPPDMRPSKTTYIGVCIAVKNSRPNSPCQIYVGTDGWLSINYMNEIDSGTGWNVPLSSITAF